MMRLVVFSCFLPGAVEQLVKHGCTVEIFDTYGVVVLPEGAQRSLVFPRVLSERYTIVLPDGCRLEEVFDPFREKSILYFYRSPSVIGE